MELKEFKEYITNFPKGFTFEFGISEPFSWRGSYAEVAFKIVKQPMTREEVLKNIKLAYDDCFYGYKGGEYRYGDYTNIHFETDSGSWSDGQYTSSWISKIEKKEVYNTQEERLVKLAFI